MQNYIKNRISADRYVVSQSGELLSLPGLLNRFDQYAILILVFPGLDRFSEDILKGFKRFCRQHGFDYRIVDSIDACNIRCGQAYIFMQDEDMMEMFERLQLLGMSAGKDVGMISFDDSPLKRVVMDGVTTISRGFEFLGIPTVAPPDVFMRSSL